MPEFGDNIFEMVILTTIVITAGAFCWFLWAERKDNRIRNETICKFQEYMYNKMVVSDLEERFGE